MKSPTYRPYKKAGNLSLQQERACDKRLEDLSPATNLIRLELENCKAGSWVYEKNLQYIQAKGDPIADLK